MRLAPGRSRAGVYSSGIEADGGVKGCLSLQAKFEGRDPFLEGNLRRDTLAEIRRRAWRKPRARGPAVGEVSFSLAGARP